MACQSSTTLIKVRFKVKRLLCVDDSPDMLDMLAQMLRFEFLVVGTLSSGSSTVAAAVSLEPDIILLDVDLGDMSGFLVAEQLREIGCLAKIVFISVHESMAFTNAAHEFGAAGYVFKSQITRDLMKTLNAAVQLNG
jgi:DNA-binding NarL/FixJ family response regulator